MSEEFALTIAEEAKKEQLEACIDEYQHGFIQTLNFIQANPYHPETLAIRAEMLEKYGEEFTNIILNLGKK